MHLDMVGSTSTSIGVGGYVGLVVTVLVVVSIVGVARWIRIVAGDVRAIRVMLEEQRQSTETPAP